MSLRVTAKWEVFGEDLQFGGAPRDPGARFGPGEAFVPGSPRRSAKEQRRKESARLFSDILR